MRFDVHFREELKNDVIEMHNNGLSENEIAKVLRQSPEQIDAIVWRYHENTNI